MNGEVQNFIERCVSQYPVYGRVLEVGSLDICGSARRWFTKDGQQKEPTKRFPQYVGVDRVAGNLVDEVLSGHDLVHRFGNQSFDVVISTSALEHDEKFWVTLEQIGQVLVHGGWLILTVPSWRGEGPHDLHDYYRFMPEGVEVLIKMVGLDVVELIDHAPSNDVMVIARKP